MELDPYIMEVRRQLAVTAEAAGEDARALAERLSLTLDATLRLILLEALGAAAAEITRELAPGSVDLRLRGREPEFVVAHAPAEEPQHEAPVIADDAAMTRINLRLPDQLKARIEQAAERDGLSINAWLVRAAAAAVDRRPQTARAPRGGDQFRGWVR
jgi:hypothetical protein